MNEPIKLPPIDSREGFSDYVEMHMRDYAISAVRQAVAAEREVCAKLCEQQGKGQRAQGAGALRCFDLLGIGA